MQVQIQEPDNTIDFVAKAELLAEGLEELKHLLSGHYDELSSHREHGYKLNPDYGFYLEREKSGNILYVTLRCHGELVGYFIGHLARDPHYRAMSLKMDIFYVVPDYRGHAGGRALMDAVRRAALENGVDPIYMVFKEEHRAYIQAMLEALGYKAFERTYVMWLGG